MPEKFLLMLPTYNERENLESLVREIIATAPEMHLLIIDDSSPDKTGEIADRLAREFSQVHVLHRPPKSGRGTASLEGYTYAIEQGYSHYMEFDCDFSHDPTEIPRMIETAGLETDLAIASRFMRGGRVVGWPWKRHLLHFMADCAVRLILGTPNTDHTNGFRCYRVEVLKKIDFSKIDSGGYVAHTILENILHVTGHVIREFPSVFYERRHGFSKMQKSEAIHGLRDMLCYRFQRLRFGIGHFFKR